MAKQPTFHLLTASIVNIRIVFLTLRTMLMIDAINSPTPPYVCYSSLDIIYKYVLRVKYIIR